MALNCVSHDAHLVSIKNDAAVYFRSVPVVNFRSHLSPKPPLSNNANVNPPIPFFRFLTMQHMPH